MVAAIGAVIGTDEILLAVGLALVTYALWPIAGQGALLPAGLVLVWIALPVRRALVDRTPETPARAARRKDAI